MNEIVLNNQVLVFLLGESILFGLLIVAFVVSAALLKRWDFESFSQQQFVLERRAYLVMTILLFVFAVKFLLLIYFVFTIDSLSLLVPGAMCAAGVIAANEYGMGLLFLKFALLFLMLLWAKMNTFDLQAKNYPLFHPKIWLFVALFFLFAVEIGIDFAYFLTIDIEKPVSCCSGLYGQLEGSNPLPFGLDVTTLVTLFYLLYLLLLGAAFSGYRSLLIVIAVLFVILSYYSVVYFFGTYIYELPTHKCPFCMLQKEYFYVGYVIWGALFGGGFMLVTTTIMEIVLKVERPKERKSALILLSIFVLLCTAYVVIYYLRNGVFL